MLDACIRLYSYLYVPKLTYNYICISIPHTLHEIQLIQDFSESVYAHIYKIQDLTRSVYICLYLLRHSARARTHIYKIQDQTRLV